MQPRSRYGALLLIFLSGCATYGTVSDADVQARRHMSLADSLENSQSWKDAALEYQLVAQNFPSSSQYPHAVWKTAILFASPRNPVASDSISSIWFRKYLALAPPKEEAQMLQLYLATVDRVKELRDSLGSQKTANDSLAAQLRKQSTDASAHTHRIQELEEELQKAAAELNKLKEIDVRISKSRGKIKQ
jgi:hypothetical protein